ncbi:hypothetical protein V1477_008798, partial [Vespula maculifrons]
MLPLLLSKQRRSFLLEVDSSEEATIGKICSELSWRLSYQRCSSVTLRLINQNLRRIIHTMKRIIIDSNESVTRSKTPSYSTAPSELTPLYTTASQLPPPQPASLAPHFRSFDTAPSISPSVGAPSVRKSASPNAPTCTIPPRIATYSSRSSCEQEAMRDKGRKRE